MRDKKTLVVIQSTDFSNIEGYLKIGLWERQRKILKEYGKNFDVSYFTSDYKLYQECMPENVKHCRLPLPVSAYGIRHICFWLYLIIRSFSFSGTIRVISVTIPVLPIIKFFSRKELIVSIHYNWAIGTKKDYGGIKGRLSETVQWLALKKADKVICTTSWLEEIVRTKYSKTDVITIPNFVDDNLFYPRQKKKQIVFAGRLHWSKGVKYLIEAFLELCKKDSDYRLIILGDGEERANLEALAKPVKDRIVFMGNQPYSKVAEIMGESDIFALPTVTMEGHPKALIEAMMCSCKCLVSNVPGSIDVMQEAGMTPYVFNKEDSSSIVEKIEYSINNDLSDIGRKFAEANYSLRSCLGKDISVLQISHNRDTEKSP